MSYSYTTTVEVEVDIDETDLSDEDLREMCEDRGLMSGGINKDAIEELYALFKQGKHDAVLALVRRVVQDAKGVVL